MRGEKYNTILNDLGFTNAEIELYIRLSHLGTSTKEKRIQIVSEKRRKILEEICKRKSITGNRFFTA